MAELILGASLKESLWSKTNFMAVARNFFLRIGSKRETVMDIIFGQLIKIIDNLDFRYPEAIYSSTSETVTRLSLMQGLPLHFPGSMVMIS
jgi:hypothetical protein